MNAPVLTYISSFSTAPRYKELDSVTLLRDLYSDTGLYWPAGSLGTVSAVWADGAAYEVELSSEYAGLATVKAEDLGPGPRSE